MDCSQTNAFEPIKVGMTNTLEIDFVDEKKGESIHVRVAWLLTDRKRRNRSFGI